jgi:hypothetical protein
MCLHLLVAAPRDCAGEVAPVVLFYLWDCARCHACYSSTVAPNSSD